MPEIPNYLAIAKTLYLTVSEVEGNWIKKYDVHGISRDYLINKAKVFAEEGKWTTFSALLAVLIYGLVLLPVAERVVDLEAICVFMNVNLVQTLLADTYFTIHSQHGKRGDVVCGTSLLYKLFMMHMPTRGPFVDTAETSLWAPRIMRLTSYDIVWHIM